MMELLSKYIDQFVGAFLSIFGTLSVFAISKYYENKRLAKDNKLKKLEELLNLIIKSKHDFEYYLSQDEIAKVKLLAEVYLEERRKLYKLIKYLELQQNRHTASKKGVIKDNDYSQMIEIIKNEMKI